MPQPKGCIPWNTGKKVFIGNKNPNWKDSVSKCMDCNKILKYYRGEKCRCIKCHKVKRVFSEATRRKFSEIRKGIKFTEEHKKNLSLSKLGNKNPNYGKKLTLEQCRKLKEANKRRVYTRELLEKLRQSKLGKNNPNYEKKRLKESILKQLATRKRNALPISPETKLKISLSRLGNKNPAWKGGITPLSVYVKTIPQAIEWKKLVLRKDNYTWQECLNKCITLEAHHIKSFAQIFQEFLQQYSQFSPIEDKETLVRLAMTYEPFWDITNGRTLCKDCHKKCTWTKKKKIAGAL